MMQQIIHVTLDGYVVRRTTAKAVGITKAAAPLGLEANLTWIPRSCCEDGDSLTEGDVDLVVAEWKADEQSLDY